MPDPLSQVDIIAQYERHIQARQWGAANKFIRAHRDILGPYLEAQRAAISDEQARGGYAGEEQE